MMVSVDTYLAQVSRQLRTASRTVFLLSEISESMLGKMCLLYLSTGAPTASAIFARRANTWIDRFLLLSFSLAFIAAHISPHCPSM